MVKGFLLILVLAVCLCKSVAGLILYEDHLDRFTVSSDREKRIVSITIQRQGQVKINMVSDVRKSVHMDFASYDDDSVIEGNGGSVISLILQKDYVSVNMVHDFFTCIPSKGQRYFPLTSASSISIYARRETEDEEEPMETKPTFDFNYPAGHEDLLRSIEWCGVHDLEKNYQTVYGFPPNVLAISHGEV